MLGGWLMVEWAGVVIAVSRMLGVIYGGFCSELVRAAVDIGASVDDVPQLTFQRQSMEKRALA
jgi:hypothetical protein